MSLVLLVKCDKNSKQCHLHFNIVLNIKNIDFSVACVTKSQLQPKKPVLTGNNKKTETRPKDIRGWIPNPPRR